MAARKTPAPPRRRKTPPKPFTLPHFRAWASDLILDNDQPFKPEPFQEAFLIDLFSGKPECWLVVPEGNGKTTLLAAIALYHCEFRPRATVHVAAASREQAETLYAQAESFVLQSSSLQVLMHSPIQAAKGKRKTDVPRFLPLAGYRRINHHGGGRIQVFAADDRTGDSTIPTLAIIDEPHRQRDLSLYRTWSGKLAKRQGQIVAISTAGELLGDFEETRARIKAQATLAIKGSFTRAETPRVVMHDWSVPETDDPEDIEAVKRANPFSGVTVEMLREKLESPTTTVDHWMRFVCNRPMHALDSWLGPNAPALWKALTDESIKPEPKMPTWVGIDVGLKRDSTAVVMVQRKDGKMLAWAKLWIPEPDKPVDLTDVMQYLREMAKTYKLVEVSFDPKFFDVPAKMLSDERLPMVEIPQSVERMTGICGNLMEAIKAGDLRHDGDPLMTAHVLGAVPRFNERGFTLAKSKSRGRIDACIALALAVDRARVRTKPRPALFVGAA